MVRKPVPARGAKKKGLRGVPSSARKTVIDAGLSHRVNFAELSPEDRRVQVAAARLRVTLDERLNRTTPPEVKALAQAEQYR